MGRANKLATITIARLIWAYVARAARCFPPSLDSPQISALATQLLFCRSFLPLSSSSLNSLHFSLDSPRYARPANSKNWTTRRTNRQIRVHMCPCCKCLLLLLASTEWAQNARNQGDRGSDNPNGYTNSISSSIWFLPDVIGSRNVFSRWARKCVSRSLSLNLCMWIRVCEYAFSIRITEIQIGLQVSREKVEHIWTFIQLSFNLVAFVRQHPTCTTINVAICYQAHSSKC